jgi:CRP/FNR family transcriptional regulator, cyclic AMP receptor protein
MRLVVADKKKKEFDPKTFLAVIGKGRKIVSIAKKQAIYTQGSACDAVFYIQTGKVRLTVVGKDGTEATLGVLNPGDFFGEGSLLGRPLRLGAATAMTNCKVMRIEKQAMMLVLRQEPKVSELFTAYLLAQNTRYEAGLIQHFFSSGEKRLARILLLLAHVGKECSSERVLPEISPETLAEMVGTTRSQISVVMNRFRKLGFIQDKGGLEVHGSLLICGSPRPAPGLNS